MSRRVTVYVQKLAALFEITILTVKEPFPAVMLVIVGAGKTAA